MDGLNLLGALSAAQLRALHPMTSIVKTSFTPPKSTTVVPSKSAIPIKTAVAPPGLAVAAQRHLDAGKRALVVAQRMSKGILAPHGAKLAQKANAMITKAQKDLSAASHRAMGAIGVMQSGTSKYGGGSGGAGGGGSSGSAGGGTTTTTSAAPPTDDSGVDVNVLNAVSQAANAANMVNAVLTVLSSGGTIKDALAAETKAAHSAMGALDDYDELLGYAATDAVNDGNALIQRAIDVIDNYDPANADQSIISTVAAINKDVAAWNQEINSIVATAPTSTATGPAAGGAPTITSILDSTNGQTSGAPGDSVIITGTNFAGVNGVTFGGSPAVPFQVVSPTQITALIPQNAATGVVQVTTPAGTASSPQPFTINPAQPGIYGGGGGGGGGYDGGGGGGGFDDGGTDDGADDGGGAMTDPSADPNNVMYDPYADEGGSFDDGSSADEGSDDSGDDGSYDDGSDDGSADDSYADEGSDDALVGHSGGGHSNGHHNGHHSGSRGFWGGPWEDVDGLEVIDAVDVDDADREEAVNDIVDKLVKRMQDKTLIGEYNITTAQRQMNTLKQVTVAIARAMVKGGQQVAAATIALAEGGLFQKTLPGITSLKNTQGHLQWHAEALSKLSDPTALYESSDDVKKWTMQAFIDANAVEEGRAQQEQIWQSMWTEIGAALAALPKEIVQTIVSLPGKTFEALTGIPAWAFWVGGAVVVVFLGIGVWKLLKIATPIATHVAVSRYLP